MSLLSIPYRLRSPSVVKRQKRPISPSYVREPQCNGVAERFIKTLKEQLLHIFYFETIEDLRCALLDFKEEYNRSWLCQKHRYKTPKQARETYIQHQKVA